MLQGGDDEVARGMTGSRIVCKVCLWESVVGVRWCRTYVQSPLQGNYTSKADQCMVKTKKWNNELFMHIIKFRILFMSPNTKYQV